MGKVVCNAVCTEFALDICAGAAGAVALGIAALDHKSGNNAVEYQPVIKIAVGKLYKVFDCYRRDVVIKLKLDHAAVFHSDFGIDRIVEFGIIHGGFSF